MTTFAGCRTSVCRPAHQGPASSSAAAHHPGLNPQAGTPAGSCGTHNQQQQQQWQQVQVAVRPTVLLLLWQYSRYSMQVHCMQQPQRSPPANKPPQGSADRHSSVTAEAPSPSTIFSPLPATVTAEAPPPNTHTLCQHTIYSTSHSLHTILTPLPASPPAEVVRHEGCGGRQLLHYCCLCCCELLLLLPFLPVLLLPTGLQVLQVTQHNLTQQQQATESSNSSSEACSRHCQGCTCHVHIVHSPGT